MKPKQREVERHLQSALSWLASAMRLAKQIPEVDTVRELREFYGELTRVVDGIEDRHDAEDALRRQRDEQEEEEPKDEEVLDS
jgi:hypothetical protein